MSRFPRFPSAAALLLLAAGAACRRGERPIEGLGTIEIVEVDAAPSVPARVASVRVDEGDTVSVGDTLAVLTQPTLPAEIEQARARVAAAEAALRELERGPRPAEIQRAEADLAAAQAEAARLARDAERLAALYEHQAVSQQQYDAARTAARTAADRRDALAQTLRLLREGTRPERIAAARAEVERARAAAAAVRATQHDLVLTSTVRGVVLGRHAEPGELLGAGQSVVTLGEASHPYVRVYVSSLVLPRVHVGAPATATLDAFPDRPVPGRVVAVSDKAEFTPRIALTESERADLLFGVKVELQDTTGLVRAGLPVTVHIRETPRATPARGEDT